MKIITWNCNGAFRKKYEHLDIFDADVLIIQECENPKESTAKYKQWTDEYLWIGQNKNKGLGIFAKKGHRLDLLNWSDKNSNYQNEQLESFLPCKIDGSLILLAVWTKKANSEVFGYIGQMWKYLQLHKYKLKDEKVVIAGDFNSNKIWDKWDRWWNHTDVVNELEEVEIKSLYHHLKSEAQGEETQPTFFHQRKLEKSYHIDFVFTSRNMINNKNTISVGKPDDWLELSDHIPILVEF